MTQKCFKDCCLQPSPHRHPHPPGGDKLGTGNHEISAIFQPKSPLNRRPISLILTRSAKLTYGNSTIAYY